MPLHLEKRRRRWYAMLDIPLPLRPQFGGKRRFLKSLETADLATAQRRLVVWITRWQADLARARGTKPGDSDAAYFLRVLRASTPDQRQAVLEQIADAADAVGYLHAEMGQTPASVPEAQEFHGRATGGYVGTLDHLEEWLAGFRVKPRTKEQRRRGVKRVAEAFALLRDISKPEVRKWAAGLELSRKSIVIILSGAAIYWRWLQSEGIAAEGDNPFERVDLANSPRGTDGREPFTPEDVVRLRAAAPDNQMRDLITLAMWTGARIEELCSLRTEHVGAASFRIVSAKTQAGVRVVPIHPKLRQTVTRLIEQSTDGYLLTGLHVDRFGFRSNTIGKRFSGFKTRMGFGPRQVFHSIRRCVVTQLENAGAKENEVAALVGHDIKTITYGLYSGGASLEVKAAALALLDYPQSG